MIGICGECTEMFKYDFEQTNFQTSSYKDCGVYAKASDFKVKTDIIDERGVSVPVGIGFKFKN